MPEIKETEKNKDKKDNFFEVFGEDVYNKIVEENGLDSNDNVFLTYWYAIKSQITSKEMLFEFSKYWKEKYSSTYKVKNPNSSSFNIILKRQFIPYYISKFENKQESEVSENTVDTSNNMVKQSDEMPTGKVSVDLSSIESKIDENKELIQDANDILKIVGEAQLENMIYNDVLNIKRILEKQVNTKTEKKATFAQIESIEARLHGLDVKLDSILDKLENIEENMPNQLKDYYSPSDRRNNLLLGLGVGVAIGLVFIILFSVLN